MQCDILIQAGEVIDPSQNLRGVRDLAVVDGRIAALGEVLPDVQAEHVIDARGLYVTPGLIDLHVHVYTHSPLGLDPDLLCAAGGVTTMLDAGSAGSNNFAAFRRDNIDRAQTQVLGLVNLSCIGLIAPELGELRDRRYADPDGVLRILQEHPDVAVGVKIRAGKHIVGDGDQGLANLRDAIRVARKSETWVMVHIGECPVSLPELAEMLAPGDCITHCFKGGSTRVTDDQGIIYSKLYEASERGIHFDIGHGFGSFQWDVAEAAIQQSFEPTTISTDLHTQNIDGPVFDMPTTMSKMLLFGVPLDRVVEMSTTRPATILKRQAELGTLRVGTVADIAVLEKHEGSFMFTDSYSQQRTGNQLLTAASTIRGGKIVPGGGGLRVRRLVEDGSGERMEAGS
jgi:dihydroorotase